MERRTHAMPRTTTLTLLCAPIGDRPLIYRGWLEPLRDNRTLP